MCIIKSPSACKSEVHIVIIASVHNVMETHFVTNSTKGRLYYGSQSFECSKTYSVCMSVHSCYVVCACVCVCVCVCVCMCVCTRPRVCRHLSIHMHK